jgi:two-component system CheB/CheR fusion protein
VVITLIDMTSLKQTENALFHERYLLNSLLASLPDAIYFRDARGSFIRANDSLATRLGLQSGQEAVGKTPFDVPNREEARALYAEDEKVLASGEAHDYRLESRGRPDGSLEWDIVTRAPLRDGDGKVVGIIYVARDVTDQIRAEHDAREAVILRDQFLAMLSHELRNPLGAIATATSMLEAQTSLADCQRYVELLERQTNHMARLLDDLLDATRVTQNKIELRRQIVDLRAVTHDALDALGGAIKESGIQLRVDVPDHQIPVDGDPTRLQQIASNLLNNACKYTQPGGRVDLSLRRQNGDALFTVRDDGVGISSDMLPKVFDLFVQAPRSLDRAQGGLGLGLTVVKSLVTLHGGTVSAESAGSGAGSTFSVRLPLAHADAEDGTRSTPPQPVPARNLKIVVVEDNEDSRELLCQLLTQFGFTCLAAPDGLEGFRLIREQKPDVAIIDIGLPEIDGFALARKIREQSELAKIHLIALTGYGQSADRDAAKSAGFDTHVVKPIRSKQLLEILGEAPRLGPD